MIRPGDGTIGVLGGGQLGRMIAVAARQLGYGVVVCAPEEDAPAAAVADRTIRAPYEDPDALDALAGLCDVLTYEFENVPAGAVRALQARRPCRPDAELLEITQDRLVEHAFLHRLGIATASGVEVRDGPSLAAGLARLGGVCRLKSARGGYDGGGQWRVADAEGRRAAEAVVAPGGRWLLEAEVAFDLEISVVVARDVSGRAEVFPVFENHHGDGILRVTRCPARASATAQARAVQIARVLAEAVNLVGTLTVECFVRGDEVVVNELAPRVHNSGHLTLEACTISQFAQHVRAVVGLPVVAPALRAPAAMVNLLGPAGVRASGALAGVEAVDGGDVHVHLYGKRTVRPRRKMGHVTALATSADLAEAAAGAAADALRFGW